MDFDIIPPGSLAISSGDQGWEEVASGQYIKVHLALCPKQKCELSFGGGFEGTYLGIDIAIKEVLPSTEYDVHKYFEREWRIMRECRHPNIVLFLGLSKAPDEDGRVFIISEYVPRGNLRQFILSSRPFPWRLRLSFATDVARAVAYLHARQCIHRDLKGENLLVTSNDRIKITDFGFARIASRNADEMRRMTYCGTDGYMSPEIINGLEFDLPTDVFSLGIILIEIMSRKLVDSKTFAREAPHCTPDPVEIHRRASKGCPIALIDLAIDCCLESPSARPTMPVILQRLRAIELEIMSRSAEAEGGEHIGSIKLVHHGGKRAMPDFTPPVTSEAEHDAVAEESDAKMEEDALVALAGITIDGSGASGAEGQDTWRTAQWGEVDGESSASSNYTLASEMRGHQRLLPSNDTFSSFGNVGTSIASTNTDIPNQAVLTASALNNATPPEDDPTASTMTVRQTPLSSPPPDNKTIVSGEDQDLPVPVDAPVPLTPLPPDSQIATIPSLPASQVTGAIPPPAGPEMDTTPKKQGPRAPPPLPPRVQGRYDRARQEEAAEESVRLKAGAAAGTHRFTLVDRDAVPLINGKKISGFSSALAFAFLPKALSATSKCPVCLKRLGQRPALQCDDCQILVHVKCSHAAPRNCDIAETQHAVQQSQN